MKTIRIVIYENAYQCTIDDDVNTLYTVDRQEKRTIKHVKKMALQHYHLFKSDVEFTVLEGKFKIYQNNNIKHYNKYYATAYTEKNNIRVDKNTGMEYKSTSKFKNFGPTTMDKIGSALKDLQNSGVNIKTYQFIRLCHDAIASFKNYDPLKDTNKMIYIACEKARDNFAILN